MCPSEITLKSMPVPPLSSRSSIHARITSVAGLVRARWQGQIRAYARLSPQGLSLPAGRRGRSGRCQRRSSPSSRRPGWPPPRTLPRLAVFRRPAPSGTQEQEWHRAQGAFRPLAPSPQLRHWLRRHDPHPPAAQPQHAQTAGQQAPSQTTSTRVMPSDSARASTCRPQTHSPRQRPGQSVYQQTPSPRLSFPPPTQPQRA